MSFSVTSNRSSRGIFQPDQSITDFYNVMGMFTKPASDMGADATLVSLERHSAGKGREASTVITQTLLFEHNIIDLTKAFRMNGGNLIITNDKIHGNEDYDGTAIIVPDHNDMSWLPKAGRS